MEFTEYRRRLAEARGWKFTGMPAQSDRHMNTTKSHPKLAKVGKAYLAKLKTIPELSKGVVTWKSSILGEGLRTAIHIYDIEDSASDEVQNDAAWQKKVRLAAEAKWPGYTAALRHSGGLQLMLIRKLKYVGNVDEEVDPVANLAARVQKALKSGDNTAYLLKLVDETLSLMKRRGEKPTAKQRAMLKAIRSHVSKKGAPAPHTPDRKFGKYR